MIESNLVGKNLTYTESDYTSCFANVGVNFKNVREYRFNSNGEVEFYSLSSSEWTGAAKDYDSSLEDQFYEESKTYDYFVTVNLFGQATVNIKNNSYLLEVDDQDNPISITEGDRIYYR